MYRLACTCIIPLLELITPSASSISAGRLILPGGYTKPYFVQLRATIFKADGTAAGAPFLQKFKVSFSGAPLSVTLDANRVGDFEVDLGNLATAEDLVLDASGWRDPDDPNKASPVSITWDCAFEIATLPCFNGRRIGTRSGSIWSIPMSAFEDTAGEEPAFNRTHTFSASVSKNDGRPAATAAVTVVPKRKEIGRVLPTAVLVR